MSPGLGSSIVVTQGNREADVHFHLAPGFEPEGYRLSVTSKQILIEASTPTGLFWAGQTLRQLLPPPTLRSAPLSLAAFKIPNLVIEDAPRFPWRGIMLDPCRHFIGKDSILKMIDLMSLHKLNRLHLHLTEDQGWRVQIKKYPRLTEIGAYRKETVIGRNTPAFDGKPHGGFYTQEDLKEIVAYARRLHITVMPEIELPGHAQAALAAYPEWGENQKVDVWTKWGVSENVYNVEEFTISILKDIFDEILEIFPSEFIHVGGDECPKVQWKNSPRTQELMRERGLKTEDELQSWFIRQFDEFLSAKGRRLVGWDEILEGGLAPGATVMSWRGMEGGVAAARAGHDVVMAPWSHVYFDHYQSERSSEPFAIGGLTPLSQTYSFEPVPPELTLEEAKHILGTQGQLWSEYFPDFWHVEYMAFPRTCALAEVAWSGPEKDYPEFLSRLTHHTERLDALGVNYRALDE